MVLLHTRRTFLRSAVLTPVAIGILSALPTVNSARASGVGGAWSGVGSLATGRSEHASAALADGRVLVTGGQTGGTVLASCEITLPSYTGFVTTSAMSTPRYGHTLTPLANGLVLAVGGRATNTGNTVLASAEVYNPSNGLWSPVASPSIGRTRHIAVLLPSGRVLVAGGYGENGYLTSSEIYNPANNSWTSAATLATARAGHTAVLLPNGRVLVAGGRNSAVALASAEVYHPLSDDWISTASMANARRDHTLTLVGDIALAVGGHDGTATVAGAERYDPATGQWSPAGLLQTPRMQHAAAALNAEAMLVVGGFASLGDGGDTIGSAEIYHATTNAWMSTGGLASPRREFTAHPATASRVLVVGGTNLGSSTVASAEIFNPATTAPTYPVTLSGTGPGTVAALPALGEHPVGTTLLLEATPQAGALFLGWKVDGALRNWRRGLALRVDGPHALFATFAPAPTFPDVLAIDPARDPIAELAARGIIQGYGDGRFGPGDTILRAQMAALIARAMGWDGEDWGNPYTDRGGIDANLWRNIGTLAHYGVAYGYGNGRFAPNDRVLRAQVASFITRAMVAKGYWQPQPDDGSAFPNVPASSGHRGDLATWAYYAGELPDNGAAEPLAGWNQPATRAWFARALWRALDRHFGDPKMGN
jgi:hypothetical protein